MNSRDMDAETIQGDLRTIVATLRKLSLPTLLRLDFTMTEYKALVVVEGSAGIGVSGLARELGIRDPAASLLVDQLVRRGYVARKTGRTDRRRVHLTTTVRGKKLLGELREGKGQHLERWLDQLDDGQLDALTRGLRALAEAARASEMPATPGPATEILKT